MGFFDFLRSGERSSAVSVSFPMTIGAAAMGTVVPMEEIPDEVFSTGVLGNCCGIDPTEGGVYAPVDGKISQLADTLHAIGLETGGVELLIHVGVDTVDMEGNGFSAKVKEGQTVKKGELLLTMDLDKIHAAGHPAVVIMAVTNSDDFAGVERTASGEIKVGSDLMMVKK